MQELQFERYNNGVVKLYGIEESGLPSEKPYLTARFQNRVVGETQFYGAKAADVKISRRIRIPMFRGIDEDNKSKFFAVIGKVIYRIERAQHYQELMPPSTDLTLVYYREETE